MKLFFIVDNYIPHSINTAAKIKTWMDDNPNLYKSYFQEVR